MDPFSEALAAISVSTELIEEELQPHLDTLLSTLQERQEEAARQIADSWILSSLAHILRGSALKLKAVLIVTELAGDALARGRCVEAGLGTALLSLLSSTDQDLLLHTCRAIGRICYDNHLLQDHLVRNGAIPPLAAILRKYPGKALVGACLFALCSLADMAEEDSSGLTWEELGRISEGEMSYRGTHRHSGFTSKVTLVRLNQRSSNQYSLTVEVVHRCSKALWGAYVARRSGQRSRSTPFGVCPRFYRIMKFGVRSIPKTQSLMSRVFHTFL